MHMQLARLSYPVGQCQIFPGCHMKAFLRHVIAAVYLNYFPEVGDQIANPKNTASPVYRAFMTTNSSGDMAACIVRSQLENPLQTCVV
jgi:hypothetical protein